LISALEFRLALHKHEYLNVARLPASEVGYETNIVFDFRNLGIGVLYCTGGSEQGPGGRGGGGFRQPDPIDFSEHAGWVSLFDGKTLNGWSGDENWKVEDGAIVIDSTCEKPTGTVYLVWQGSEAADFELKLEMKGTGNINGGIQCRGWIVSPNPPPRRWSRRPAAADAVPQRRTSRNSAECCD
jgi:hypothetical protein